MYLIFWVNPKIGRRGASAAIYKLCRLARPSTYRSRGRGLFSQYPRALILVNRALGFLLLDPEIKVVAEHLDGHLIARVIPVGLGQVAQAPDQSRFWAQQ